MRRGWLLGIVLVCGCGDQARRGGPGSAGADMAGPSSFGACATAEHAAVQEPAAMMVVLDRSSSMANANKWTFAAQAIVQALDGDVFDGMSVGLYAAPTGSMTGPQCIYGLPVACQAPPFPQIDLQPAGSNKSSASSGVRHDIKSWLTTNVPDSGIGDASPMYAGIDAALTALKGWSGAGKRILFVVTDGTLSCCQFSSRSGFADGNGCDHDWEHPDNLAQLLSAANQDPQTPVESFVVGVPGADTYDASGKNYPPYRMRLALSSLAWAGSPKYAPPTCTGKTFSQSGADPTLSCHFDMTQGNFSAQSIADAIAHVRGEVLGCVFDLPAPTDGTPVDKNLVNVSLQGVGLYQRIDPANPCTSDGCWDWTPDGRVELVGQACTTAKGGGDVKVSIVVGCQTVIK